VNTVLTLLAVAGVATAAWHLVRAALRFLRQAAAGIWADELADTHARRGDLTSLESSREERVRATRSGARYGVEALGWLVLLAVPSLTAWPRPLYAAYSLLLLEPALRRLRA
jgi:hypothetical protein